MFNKVLWKCYLVVGVCFLMCPKRVRVEDKTLAIEQNKVEKSSPENGTATKELEPEIVTTPKELGPENVTTPKKLSLQSETPLVDSFLGPNKPGFDLTKEEMAKFNIWPQGVAPYYIDELSFDNSFREGLRSFLESVESTGLHFFELSKPPEDQSRWVFFINRRGILECPDYTTYDFTNNGVQRVILGYDCLDKQRALASTVLALAGVPPQHNAPNRDQYVDVNIENVLPDKRHLFKALENNEWLFHDLEYDYNSAGHFDWHKYSANGQATIKPKKIEIVNDVQSRAFSLSDLQKIKMLYNFISKHENVGSPKKAQCNYLFVPGSNLTNYYSDSAESIKPLSKPKKYLGGSDDIKKLGVNDHDYNIANNVESNKVDNKDSVGKYVNYTDDDSNIKSVSDEGDKNTSETNKIINEIEEKPGKGETEDDNVRDNNDVNNTVLSSKEESSGNISKYVNFSDINDEKTISDRNYKNVTKRGKVDSLSLTLFKDRDNNGGEDTKENEENLDDENESAFKDKLSPFAKKLKLNKKTTYFTQDPIFDKSDYNTEERIQKLKLNLYERRNNQ